MDLSFRQFLIETQTITQWLKMQDAGLQNDRKLSFSKLRQEVTNSLSPNQLPQKLNQLMVNYYIAQVMKGPKNFITTFAGSPLYNQHPLDMERRDGHVGAYVQRTMSKWRDFLVANIHNGQIMSKLNTVEYTPEEIDNDAEEWHKEMEVSSSRPGPEGKPALLLDNVGPQWRGWKWVSLGCGYSREEGDAAGHCGNSGAVKGDNILSLRDAKNHVHLTFIVNNGVLGESKSRNNQKPSPKYHQVIIALLKSPLVQTILGGGYAPERNFQLEDLTEEEQAEIKKIKPNIDYIDYAFNSKDPKMLAHALNTTILEVKNDAIVLAKCETWKELYEELGGSRSNKKLEDFSWLDDPIDFDWGSSSAKDGIDYMNRDNRNKVEELIARELDVPEDDVEIEEMLADIPEIEEAIEQAMGDGYQVGAENEAYKSVTSSLSSTDNGFYVDFKTHPYEVCISLKSAKSLFQENRDEIDNQGLAAMFDFSHSAPYNGYSEFDKDAFNERLAEKLSELDRDLEKQKEDPKQFKMFH